MSRITKLLRPVLPALLLVLTAGPVQAQRQPAGSAEVNLMAFFASAMAFTPVGLPGSGWEAGGTLSFIPRLPDEDRAAGFGGTKYENVNACPVFPRLTVSRSFGALALEAGWTPPVQVCGARANLVAAALSYRREMGGQVTGFVRAAVLGGWLEAAITCDDDAVANTANQTCYGGLPSDDRLAPLTLALEIGVASRRWAGRRFEPYLLAGVSRHRFDFDVNFERAAIDTGAVLLPALIDHSRFRGFETRFHAAAGAAWQPLSRLRLGAELYLSPGALTTVRGRASIPLGGAGAR